MQDALPLIPLLEPEGPGLAVFVPDDLDIIKSLAVVNTAHTRVVFYLSPGVSHENKVPVLVGSRRVGDRSAVGVRVEQVLGKPVGELAAVKRNVHPVAQELRHALVPVEHAVELLAFQ